MTSDAIHNETDIASNTENSKIAWHRPNVTRIDIKRTLAGVGSAVDLSNGPSIT